MPSLLVTGSQVVSDLPLQTLWNYSFLVYGVCPLKDEAGLKACAPLWREGPMPDLSEVELGLGPLLAVQCLGLCRGRKS